MRELKTPSGETQVGLQELTNGEINMVGGATFMEGAAIFAVGTALGTLQFGSAALGSVAVATAFAAAPVTVVAMVGIALFAGYQIMQD